MNPQQPSYTTQSFAQSILKQYPNGVTADGIPYSKLSPDQLTQKIVAKYPVYKTQIKDYSEPKPRAVPGYEGSPNVQPGNAIQDIKKAASAGADQINEGVTDIKNGAPGKSPIVGGLEAGLKVGSGIASVVSSPFAPAFRPVGDAINAAGDAIGNIPAVQKFAATSAGENTSRVAEDLSNAGNIAGTIVGADQAIKTVPGAISTLKNTTSNATEAIKGSLTTTPPTPEEMAASQAKDMVTQKSNALKAHNIVDKEVRNTAEKYHTVGEALNNAEVNRGSEPIKVMSSYPEGKALPTMTPGGKMNSIPAINFLKTQVSTLGKIKENLVGTTKEITPIEDFKQAAFDRIDKGSGSLAKKSTDKADVGKIIDGLQATYPDGIPATELDKIKTEQAAESKSYKSKSPFSADSHAIVGQTAADAVVTNGGAAPIDELNKLLTSHYDAIKVLKAMNGKTPHGGMFSRHMGGIAGEVAGLAGGIAVGHPFIGAMVGRGASEFVNNILSSHFISNPLKATLIKGMKGEDPAVIQQALDYINASEKNTPTQAPTEPTTQPSLGAQ